MSPETRHQNGGGFALKDGLRSNLHFKRAVRRSREGNRLSSRRDTVPLLDPIAILLSTLSTSASPELNPTFFRLINIR